MKKWLKNKLGLNYASDIAKEWADVGKIASEGFAKGLETGLKRTDGSWPCAYCKGTGSSSYGPGIDEEHRCGHCNGTGRDHDPLILKPYQGQMEKSPIEHMNDAYNKAMDKTDTGKNVQSVHRDNHTIIDPLLKDVQETVWEQQAKVLASGKYDHPVHKDNHTAMEWSDHQLSEFADALVYHQAMKQTIMDVYGLISDAYMESVDPVVDEHLVNAMNRLRRR